MWSHVISQRPRSTADCVLTLIFVSPGKKKKKKAEMAFESVSLVRRAPEDQFG